VHVPASQAHLSLCYAPLPFVAVYEARVSASLELSLESFPGLTAVHLLQSVTSAGTGATTQGVYSIWTTYDHFRGSADSFLGRLQEADPNADLVWTAWRQRGISLERHESKWAYIPGAAHVVIAVSAFVAAVALLRTSFLTAVDTPDVRDIASHKIVNSLRGDPWDVEFQLENTAEHLDCSIDVKNVTLVSTTNKAHSWQSGEIGVTPGVKPGSPMALHIDPSTFPTLEDLSPDLYEVAVDCLAEGDSLRARRERTFTKRLKVWDKRAQGKPKLLMPADQADSVAQILIPILVGSRYEKGFECYIVMQGCTVAAATSPVANTAPHRISGPDGMAVVRLRTQPVGPTQQFNIQLALQADRKLTRAEWQKLVDDADLKTTFHDAE
jgi:hypothetical protein